MRSEDRLWRIFTFFMIGFYFDRVRLGERSPSGARSSGVLVSFTETFRSFFGGKMCAAGVRALGLAEQPARGGREGKRYAIWGGAGESFRLPVP